MKINPKVYNGLIIGTFVVGSILTLGLAFGYVTEPNRELVARWVTALVGAGGGLLAQKGE